MKNLEVMSSSLSCLLFDNLKSVSIYLLIYLSICLPIPPNLRRVCRRSSSPRRRGLGWASAAAPWRFSPHRSDRISASNHLPWFAQMIQCFNLMIRWFGDESSRSIRLSVAFWWVVLWFFSAFIGIFYFLQLYRNSFSACVWKFWLVDRYENV